MQGTVSWADEALRFVGAAQRGRSRSLEQVTKRVRLGYETERIPMGSGNGKTGAPGTYRPVGATCPDSCPQLESGACYALTGPVGLQQSRASEDPVKAVRSALAAIVAARVSGVGVARLHVSGDFGREAADVEVYVRELLRGLNALRRVTGWTGVLAWSYTHSPHMGRWMGLLRSAGVAVRVSDKLGWNGAVVVPFDRIGEARAMTRLPVAKCPAQLRDVTCTECALCWTRPDVVIAFDPHGVGKSKVIPTV